MRISVFYTHERFYAVLSVCIAVVCFAAPSSSGGQKWTCTAMEKINAQKNPDYKKEMEEAARKDGENSDATSCYRTPEEQRQACIGICGNGDGCPGSCAPPGRSNHQKVSTADIQGLKGDVKAGCEYLYNRCQTLRASNPSMGCEIGGYGSGAHHFAFGPIKNSAYNQCAFLKPKMGQDPSAWKKQEEEGNKLYNEVMNGGSPSAPGASWASSGGPGGGGGGRGTSAPSPYRGASQAPPETRNFETAKIKESNFGSPLAIPGSKPKSFGKNDFGNRSNESGITNESESAKSRLDEARGAQGEGPSSKGASHASGAADSLGLSKTSAGTKAVPRSSNEALANFANGGKGSLGSPNVNIGGSEVATAVKNLASDFGMNQERNPASGNEQSSGNPEGVSSLESADLFFRCHAAHVRCVRSGCVKTSNITE